MSKALLHSWWMILELLRQPSYIVSTIAFPGLFYIIFAVPESNDVHSSNLLLASFSTFAVFGVVFLQLGVGVAQERSKSWYLYLRTLPLSAFSFILARLLSSIFFSILAAMGIVILALSLTQVSLSFEEWRNFFISLILAGSSFCFMGISLGYWVSEKSSLPIGNLIYLPLSFAGGLWKPPNILPSSLSDISELLPTRHYGEIMWAITRGDQVDFQNVFWLLGYAMFFSMIAFWGHSKDQISRFS